MMPTTSAASTPSRSAIRNAESTGYPVSPVVNDLQLQIRVYPRRALYVNRTNLVRFPQSQNRLFCFVRMSILRQGLSVALSSLLLFSQASSAQSEPPASQVASQAPSQALTERVKPDAKRARKAA